MIELELGRIRKQPHQISQKVRNFDKFAALPFRVVLIESYYIKHRAARSAAVTHR